MQKPDAAASVRDRFLGNIALPPSSRIALTVAQKDELDPMPLGLALLAMGYTLCLPTVVDDNKPLVFRAWNPGDPLASGPFSIPEPLPEASVAKPNIIFVPLLAFDRFGNRLGQGGGYYDRTLMALRQTTKILAVGLGFAEQEISCVPTTSHDAPLDVIVTEQEVFWPKMKSLEMGR